MSVTTKIISFLLIVFSLNCCTIAKEIYYSYKTVTYTIDTVKKPLYYENLISVDDYLIEFRIRTNIRTEAYENSSGSTSIDYDTIGVYLLSDANKLFYEFDTFALKNKVVKIGRLKDKPFGQKINFHANESSSNLSFTLPKKIIINDIQCFVTQVISNSKMENDSIEEKILPIKNSKFNSPYKINGIKFMDNNYCIVGFQIHDLKQNQSYGQELELLRPLNRQERDICENMIKASKAFVIDTAQIYPQ